MPPMPTKWMQVPWRANTSDDLGDQLQDRVRDVAMRIGTAHGVRGSGHGGEGGLVVDERGDLVGELIGGGLGLDEELGRAGLDEVLRVRGLMIVGRMGKRDEMSRVSL